MSGHCCQQGLQTCMGGGGGGGGGAISGISTMYLKLDFA